MTVEKAQKIFIANSREWLAPEQITPDHVRRADDILGGDALSAVMLNFTTKVESSCGSLEKRYQMPIAIYLLTGDQDLSEEVTNFLVERIGNFPEEKLYSKLCLQYVVSSQQHLNDKNMAHFLISDAKLFKRPHKLKLLKLLLQFECVQTSSFLVFQEREEWIGPNTGRPCGHEFETYRNLMDCAISSGNPANVALAIENGLEPRYLERSSSYGGSAMGYLAQYAWQSSYEAIARLLIKQAEGTGKLAQLLKGGYRTGFNTVTIVENLSRAGLVDLVDLCSQVAPGKEDLLDLKAAIFKNLRGDGDGWKSSIYQAAINFLGITPPGEEEEEFVAFCLALRRAVVEEAKADPNFLLEEVKFTQSFKTRALKALESFL